MTKRFIIIIILLVIIFGAIFGWDGLRSHMIAKFKANFIRPAASVTASTVKKDNWQPYLTAIGSLDAINGVALSPQQSGVITKILFKSGQTVKANTPLVQQDTAVDEQDLKNYQANLVLAKADYARAKDLNQKGYVSNEKLDQAQATLEQAQANVQKTKVIIEEKTIRAPFAGKLGIRNVNIGEFVQPGSTVVNIQQLDPLRIIFNLPQQDLASLYIGQKVEIEAPNSRNANKKYYGKITALDSSVNQDTRNISVQAVMQNPNLDLLPGMYVNVKALLPKRINVITIPQTAISYNPYGDFVYVIEHKTMKIKDKEITGDFAKQVFITPGDTRGGQISVEKGLKVGQRVITSGQLKVQNGTQLKVEKDPNFTANKSVNPAELH